MRPSIRLRLVTILLGATLVMQVSGQNLDGPSPGVGTTILQASTQLVIVDVVVQSRDGRPVHGLKQEMFHLIEGSVPQQIRHFEEHSATQRAATLNPEMPKLPAGTFTDYSPVAPDATLNVLLLDSLNTPVTAQSYVRDQLQEYIKHANPGTRVAIFGLANQLVLLQGFTSDPDTLKEAIKHKLIPRYSSLLDDPGGNGVDHVTPSDITGAGADQTSPAGAAPLVVEAAANFQQFEAETTAIQTQMRLQYTLDAFNALGHYLAAFPGRKNLIWFSGAFPLNVLPDASLQNSFAVANVNQDAFHEMTNLLAKAQVAVYPVDARGLTAPPVYSASSSGRRYGTNPQAINSQLSQFNTSQASEHTTMDTLAENTGGRAFYNTNALSDAVSKAVDAGANYYTLTYSPTDHTQDGGYRKITVECTGGSAGANLHLSYRHGYYASDAARKQVSGQSAVTLSGSTGGPAAIALAYQRAAMSRGAPAPQEILFTARVLPAANTTEATPVQSNRLSAGVSPKGPFRRYDIDYVVLPKDATLTLQPDGRRQGAINFMVYVFDGAGELLNAESTSLSLNLNPKDYATFLHNALQMHLEVSVPVRGESFLRIGVSDVPSNRFGVVEIPVAAVSNLAPPVYPGVPSTAESSHSTSPQN